MIRITILSAVLVAATLAHADDHKVADELFEQAQQKRAGGDETGACKLFADSLAKNPNAVGTILNVALCEEKAGKLTAAHHRFRDARDRAREQGLDEHITASEKHMTELAAKVGYVTFAFVEAPTPRTQVEIDGVVIDAPSTELMLDPGAHTLRVIAPDRLPHTATFNLTPGQHAALAVPALATPSRGGRVAGKVLTVGGAAMVTTAVVLGLVANRNYEHAFDNGSCIAGDPPQCNADGYKRTGDAHSLGNIATVIGGVGVVTAGIGLYFWLRPERRRETQTAVIPTVTDTSLGLAATGRF